MIKIANPSFKDFGQNNTSAENENLAINQGLREGTIPSASTFDGAESFDQLHESINEEVNKEGNIKGTIGEYSSEDLKYVIDGVRRGEFEINTVTRTKGLREKVWQLLNNEHSTISGRIQEEAGAYENARTQLGMEPEIPPQTVALESLRAEDKIVLSLAGEIDALKNNDKESAKESAGEVLVNPVSLEKYSEKTETPTPVETVQQGIRFEEGGRSKLINELAAYCKNEGIEGQIVSIQDNPQFKEGIVFKRDFAPGEKMVRLYRGLNLRDKKDSSSSVMNQIPYALRSVDTHGNMTEMKDADQEVKNLAENPTYENLIAYANKARPLLKDPYDIEQLDRHVKMIEDSLLDGYSVRQSQIQNQFAYAGGSPFHAPTPYISAAPNVEGAIGYGYEALMVIDIPLSEIDEYRTLTDRPFAETMIKGKLDQKYISAILSRANSQNYDKDSSEEIAKDAVSKVDSAIKVPHLEGEEFKNEFDEQVLERASQDEIQKEKDIELIVEKRLNDLARSHREFDMESSSKDLTNNPVEKYRVMKEKIFDHYLDKLSKLEEYSLTKEDINQERFGDGRGRYTNFDSSKITEKMLTALRNRTEAEEERYEDSKRRKAKRDAERK